MCSIGELTTIGTSLARPVIARAQIDIAKVGYHTGVGKN